MSRSTTAFIIGNGTSRKSIDLHQLKKNSPPGSKIYGCNALYREFEPDYLVAVDSKMIAEINHPGITPIVANAHNLPFEDSSFELIYMRYVIHYIDDPALAFSEIYRCLKPNGCFLFSQVVPPDDSISEEYDWLIGRDIHYPTQGEIIQLFSKYSSTNQGSFILKNQSIMNWLNNTCNDKTQKQNIIDRHRRTSNEYKSLANFKETEDDILVNIKHLMMIGNK